jgi:restriction system protein
MVLVHSALDWEELQELVAGILRAMGYKTRISPRGSDRGKDVEASPDGLGLTDPHIIVEVKHREGTMGSQDLRSFIAVLRPRHKGLYVSTGGITKEARYEADRANNQVSLIDSDELVNLIIHYYDGFDAEARSLLPLRKIYWPE